MIHTIEINRWRANVALGIARKLYNILAFQTSPKCLFKIPNINDDVTIIVLMTYFQTIISFKQPMAFQTTPNAKKLRLNNDCSIDVSIDNVQYVITSQSEFVLRPLYKKHWTLFCNCRTSIIIEFSRPYNSHYRQGIVLFLIEQTMFKSCLASMGIGRFL